MPAADAPLLEVRGVSKHFAGVKAVDRAMTIERVELVEKAGGHSGHFVR